MRIRRSPSGGSMEHDTRLLIEERLPSAPFLHNRSTKRFLGRHSQAITLVLLFVLALSFFKLQFHLRELETLTGGPYRSEPLSEPEVRVDGTKVFKIGVVTDLDQDSKKGDKWHSIMKTGTFSFKQETKDARVQWKSPADDIVLTTEIAAGGRAMELSDLVVFNHRLLTIDDRTGLIYEISENAAVPWVFLNDGPGHQTKPIKGEWMTVKDDELWIGGLGKEWTNKEGVYINDHPMWVKVVDRTGRVRHINWADNYRKVREECGILPPGYMVHESVQWSSVHKKWFFLPRRASVKSYNDQLDEQRGTNMLISADEYFKDISMIRVGPGTYEGTKGFSAFQFVPGTQDEYIIALKSEEIGGRPAASHITVFDISGTVIMNDTTLPGSHKFEGLAFI
ncbi:unnamed protein product [Auanema sp. JU1783]|nr:unnamed protein product [Auanema sp. JU1783]